MENTPRILGLDHVALTVSDLDRSETWYRDILGLEIVKEPVHWGPYPVMALANGSGIALFPAKDGGDSQAQKASIRFLHLAFRVEQTAFDNWRARFDRLSIPYRFEDLHYYHSLFLLDPDGHEIELTCLRIPLPTALP